MLAETDVDLAAAVFWAEEVLGSPVVDVTRLSGGWTSTMLRLLAASGEAAVLRLMTEEPWRTHGEGLTTRESEIQRMLAGASVPAPRTLGLDAAGERCGHPAHLMTLLPGAVDLDRTSEEDLRRLATTLAEIHAVRPSIEVREYQSWAWEAKYAVPDWAGDAGLWEAAFALLRTEVPAYEACFIHRDFHLRNVLWSGADVSGVVDWVETSIGPAWLDVAHCATNLAIHMGLDEAERFEETYATMTGRAAEPYFDVMDVVGFLPPPGRRSFWTDPVMLGRLEERLAVVMGLCG